MLKIGDIVSIPTNTELFKKVAGGFGFKYRIKFTQDNRRVAEIQGSWVRLNGDAKTWFYHGDLEQELSPLQKVIQTIRKEYK